jgi:hypothetical protein
LTYDCPAEITLSRVQQPKKSNHFNQRCLMV